MGLISLHIEAETSKDLREKLLILLGIAEHPLAFQHTGPVNEHVHIDIPSKPESQSAGPALHDSNVPGAETETGARKLRGRPRKVAEAVPETTPAEVKPVEQAKAEPAAPPTMFDVTPSEYAKTAPVQAPPVINTPVVNDVTFEKVKEALQKVAAVRPTDTNEMAGLNRATEIIGKAQAGCKKIKEIKSENYAAILAACLTA